MASRSSIYAHRLARTVAVEDKNPKFWPYYAEHLGFSSVDANMCGVFTLLHRMYFAFGNPVTLTADI